MLPTYKIFLNFKSGDKIALQNYQFKLCTLLANKKIFYKLAILPSASKRYSVLRSPHIYKKSIETFEKTTYTITFSLIFKSVKDQFFFLESLKKKLPLKINLTIKFLNNV